IAAGQPILRGLAERRALARLPNASAGAPNILLIILDTVRASSLSLYGYDQPTTPGLDQRAKRGAVFDRALSTTSWTLPSHASMFTGRYPYNFPASWEIPLGSEFPTLAEVLQEHGYATGGFVANLLYTQRESGLARGFIHYEDFRVSREQLKESTALGQRIYEWQGGWVSAKRAYDRKPGEEVSSSFLRWVDQTRDAPFFAFLNYYDAHVPYRAPQPWRDRFKTGRRDRDRYDASIAFLDQEIDGLLEELQARGHLENTIVVLTSDHGELFGEHGLEGHGNGLYDPTLHVPLVIWYPPVVQTGRRIERPVTLRDLPATLLDLAGIANHPLGGTSLRPLFRGDTATSGFSPLLAHLRKGIKTPPDQPVSKG
ncbi:MAG: sulfatase, partial [Gemmatimonadales bacterium]